MNTPTSEEVREIVGWLRVNKYHTHPEWYAKAADLIERLAREVALYKAGNAELYDRLEARDAYIEELENETSL